MREKIGGTSESKSKITAGLTDLMENKYSKTVKPNANYNTEVNSTTNLEINKQNMVDAANFKIKINK